MSEKNDNLELARRLGIPDDAAKVIVFGESSHWDPNWLLTSKEYYRLFIQKTLDAVIRELEAEPRRVYSAECVFFLKMYWDRNPDKHNNIRKLISERRLRLTGSGITTPDVMLPEVEAIIRDYLLGQEWLRHNDLDCEPNLAYLPDDFGFPATLPSVLSSLGIENVVITRIDGSYFLGSDLRRARHFPKPGTTAELLQRELKTSDFIWKGPDGSKVLCHWNAFTYGHGDTIAFRGPAKWMGYDVGIPDRSPKQVARKINGYVKQLSTVARTRYMFCTIGFDFNGPVKRLVDLTDDYNKFSYPATGTWAINAGLDDYMELIGRDGDLLPELEVDPNPFYTGFYSARPEMKQRCKKLVTDLVNTEKIIALKGADIPVRPEDIASAWDIVAVANHHDFITGTSPQRVWLKEQKPWLEKAQADADKALAKAIRDLPPQVGAVREPPPPPDWELRDGKLRAETKLYSIEISEKHGGCCTSWTDISTSQNMLLGVGNDAVSYQDTGGLWLMGHEFLGGTFCIKKRVSESQSEISADEKNGILHIEARSMLEGRRIARELWLRGDSPFVRMRLTGSACKRRTVTCRFSTRIRPSSITMDAPGGIVERPLVRAYDPTFWPAPSFAHLRDAAKGWGMAIIFGRQVSITANAKGVIDFITLRNAPKERAFGFIPLLGHPSYGEDPDEHSFEYAVAMTPSGNWHDNKLHLMSDNVLGDNFINPDALNLKAQCDSGVNISHEDVRLLAFKPAHRGEGLIVRLQTFGPKEVTISLVGKSFKKAVLCDARERDLRELPVEDGSVKVPFNGSITTARLLP